ncbi:metallophosphoesterase [Pyxidicoccus trucidator]|uniref:metallophosphoesterase n=1 Tax=Pyxidicoccus trucidator TaxID=2709662 RepID=UPI0013DAD776|nr:metallophosphoesterase [Pyxidicoccus trucidator]
MSSTGRSYENPRFRLELSAPATVTLDLMSSVDTYLYLLNQDGSQLLAQDDDSGDGYNSRLTVSLGAGRYMLVAATYSPGQLGDFTLNTSHGGLAYCFTAYVDVNFSGASNTFCEGGSQPFYNDAYSSLRVPKGLRVRAFEHSGGVGRARTYFQDAPNLGGSYNDMISSFSWSNFQVNDFFMVFASDPQFSWKHCNDDSGSALCAREQQAFGGWNDDDLARYYNTNVVNGINQVKNLLGEYRFGGTVVNGDLTEFGNQDVDLGDYINIYERGVQSNVYLGLGNHDYDNNVNDCYENYCATNMVWYFRDQVWTLNPSRFDYSESGVYYEFPSNRKNHAGSLGYSWDIGNVHFVQLNNYPTYTRDWNGWNFGDARRDYFYIQSAIAWLRNDLQNAVNSGKELVVNLHDWGMGASGELMAVLNDFPVSAVYAGHWHGTYGRYETRAMNDGRGMPVFLGGSAHVGSFLVTRFVNNKMYTWVMSVDQFNGGGLRVLYNGNAYAASTPGLFDVCTGCSRYYQDVFDMR